MADNVAITPGSGKTVLADEVTDGTLGTGIVQIVKIMDATLDGTNKLIVSAAGAAKVDGSAVTQPVSIASQPSEALNATSDLTRAYDDGATAAEESLVSATASQTTRVHRIVATADAACDIELRDGSAGTVLRKLHFPAAGAYVLDFNARPWAKTTANTALFWARSAAVACTIEIDYVKSA
jgi:hypothetical protein